MELDTTLLNTQHYKVRFKGKVEQSWEWSSALPYTLVQQLSKREPSGRPRLWSLTLLLYKVNQIAKTYIHRLSALIGCRQHDLQKAIADRDAGDERELMKSVHSTRGDDDVHIPAEFTEIFMDATTSVSGCIQLLTDFIPKTKKNGT